MLYRMPHSGASLCGRSCDMACCMLAAEGDLVFDTFKEQQAQFKALLDGSKVRVLLHDGVPCHL